MGTDKGAEQMNVAIWIIAIVEVIRMLQNCIQIMQIKKANANPHFERATDEFIKSLHKTDAEFIQEIIKGVEE